MSKRVLFVDDEQSILSGIRRLFHGQRHEWDMAFATSGQEALQLMEQIPTDVIVTDMRMPEMDGAELLAIVRERYPETVRIILSGQTDLEGTIKRLPLAHQFLHKPCDPDQLRETVRGACELQSRLSSKELRRFIGSIESLPSAPKVLQELGDLLNTSDISIEKIVSVIERDVALSAKLLQLVNSAVINNGDHVSSVVDAANRMGVDVIRNMITAVTVVEEVATRSGLTNNVIEELDAHSYAVAALASLLVDNAESAQHAFVGGLLHDVGMLIVSAYMPSAFEQVLQKTHAGEPIDISEREVIGATHAELGAYLLELWGLPYFLIEMVACHHDEIEVGGPITPIVALQIAERVAATVREKDAMLREAVSPIEGDILDKLQVHSAIEQWRLKMAES